MPTSETAEGSGTASATNSYTTAPPAGNEANRSNVPTGGLISGWEGMKPVDVDFKDGPALSLNDPRKGEGSEPRGTYSPSQPLEQNDTPISRKPVPATSPSAAADSESPGRSARFAEVGGKNEVDDGTPARSQPVEPTRYGQAYSERNPPPNIAAFREHQEGKLLYTFSMLHSFELNNLHR